MTPSANDVRPSFWAPQPAINLVNRLLSEEPWARELLRPFAGKSACLSLPPFSLTFAISGDGLLLRPPAEDLPVVTITLPLARLASVGLAPESAAAHVRIEGDADFAQALAVLARQLRPDLEEGLARVFGDVLGVRLAAALNALSVSVREGQRKLGENIAEYLLEEQPLLIRPGEIDEHSAAVRVLRDDLARLEKRIERLVATR